MEEEEYELEFPDCIYLEDYGGDFDAFIEAAYEIFSEDFLGRNKVTEFKGVRLSLKKHPLVDDKAYTFYHMTHEGKVEDDRIPDLRRLERIPFPRPMIENPDASGTKILHISLDNLSGSVFTEFERIPTTQAQPMIGPTGGDFRVVYSTENLG